MRHTLTVGILGAVALTAGILLVRQQRSMERPQDTEIAPAGESQPAQISLDKIRARGF
jgi:hypothetical protein